MESTYFGSVLIRRHGLDGLEIPFPSISLVCQLSAHEGENAHAGSSGFPHPITVMKGDTDTIQPRIHPMPCFFLNNRLPLSEGDVRQIVDIISFEIGSMKPLCSLSVDISVACGWIDCAASQLVAVTSQTGNRVGRQLEGETLPPVFTS